MMEGITSEAASLAGHLRLANLCWIYDSNRVTIEGHTDIAFSEDVAARFLAYGWNVTTVTDPNDLTLLDRAYRAFLRTTDRPTLILVHSHIGYGAPHLQDSPKAHGEPLGEDEVRLTKEFFGFPPDKSFVVPDGVPKHFAAGMGARGAAAHAEWDKLLAGYRGAYPELAEQIDAIQAGDAAGRLGVRPAGLPARCEGRCDARRVGQGAERTGPARALAAGRRGRPGTQHQDPPDLRRCRRASRRRDPSAIIAAAISISAFASTRCAPRSTA